MKNQKIIANSYINRDTLDAIFEHGRNNRLHLLERINSEDSRMKQERLIQYVTQAAAKSTDKDIAIPYAFVKAIEEARLVGAEITLSIYQLLDEKETKTDTCYAMLLTEGGSTLNEIIKGITAEFFGAIEFSIK